MKKFLVLYMMPVSTMDEMMKNTSAEDRKKNMGEWMTWMNEHKASFAEMGTPLGKNTRVSGEGASEVRNEVGGYSILMAESQEEAAKLLAGSPHNKMKGAYMEVMECMQMGM